MKFIAVLVLVAVTATAIQAASIDSFEQFKRVYNKVYSSPEEEALRRKNFEDSLKYIRENEHFGDVEINEMADLSDDEFRAQYMMDESAFSAVRDTVYDEDYKECKFNEQKSIPASSDLREEGTLTSIKNQGPCGSCWAFSGIAAVESALKAKGGEKIDLSEQELVDCAVAHGCRGARITDGFDYIKKNGVVSFQTYPYNARENQCKHNQGAKRYFVSDYCLIHPANETQMRQAITQTKTAISIIINIKDMSAFRFYNGKTIFRKTTGNNVAYHAVNIVGYGNKDGVDYWILRNSWGSSWGDHGYGYFEQHKDILGMDDWPFVVSV